MEQEAGLWFFPSAPATLYFGTEDASGVAREVRWLPEAAETLEERVEMLVEALIDGPRTLQLVASIPPGTRLRSVRIDGDLVTLDFSAEIAANHPGGSAGELTTVYSVVNTLTEVEGVRAVQWLVEGRVVESLAGHMDLTRPIGRNESLIVEPWAVGVTE